MPRLINEDEAKEVLTDYYHIHTTIQQIAMEEAFSRIPTVEAEPVRHGHWEKPQRHGVVTYDEQAYAECSCCHKPEYLARGMNYCPNCGAKMDEEEENAGN